MTNFHNKVLLLASVLFFASVSFGLLFGDESTSTPISAVQAPKDESGCFACHSKLTGAAAVSEETWGADTHHKAGASCVSCHGGNPDPSITLANWQQAHKTKSEGGNFVGKFSRESQPEMCGSCHENVSKMQTFTLAHEDPTTGINAEFWESKHGKALKAGNASSASCVDCHGSHGAMKASEPASLTYPKNISNMCGSCHSNEQYITASLEKSGKSYEDHSAAYMESVHAKAIYVKNDLTAPTCNDCHGNHTDYPAGATKVAEACNTCHVSIAQNYAAGPHQAAYAANNNPGCISCHGSPNGHAIANWNHDKVGAHEGAQCTNCHNANVPEPLPYEVKVSQLMQAVQSDPLTSTWPKTARDSVDFAVRNGFYSGILYLGKAPESFEDSLRLVSFYFKLQMFAVRIDTREDSIAMAKFAPKIFPFVGANKIASLANFADTVGLVVEVLDYAASTRRYEANLRALGSATKLNASLVSMETTYKNAKEFLATREKKGDYVKPEEEFLESYETQVNNSGGNHHVVRYALFEEAMAEGLTQRDSVQNLVESMKKAEDQKIWVFSVVGVLVLLLVISLGTLVSRLNGTSDAGKAEYKFTRRQD
ncbi:MAG: cytochrome c3 family protein [Chloroherpetonaceae bacterium]|nr:cytochrome c3 family protein [Chloroherpetonaceae bacterium]